ncbi:hypothetical protein KIW84_032670 [Lathyrus oleraceus]|uniref:Uncharacterized protein n=1 Tax=Pisum sativum TaxID=3888 RepID=A0A9D4XZ64_PEA|nr:hypothetical protein KIW84_032670 [Pisum sativum]
MRICDESLKHSFGRIPPAEESEIALLAVKNSQMSNGKEIREEADLLEEKRMVAAFTSTIARKSATPGYGFRVRPREFNIEDLGLRRVEIEKKNVKDGKLAANWKSPYRVWAGTGKGAYFLKSLEREHISRTWNIAKLKRYYS